MRATYRLGALVAALSLLLAGCSAEVAPRPSGPPERVPEEYAQLYSQELVWESCYTDMDCTTAVAPVDWAHPDGAQIELALVRHQATAQESLGSLFVNPGGPGASGADFIANSLDYAVSADVKRNYDVIGFDPRGVGSSTPITCVESSAVMDEFLFGLLDAPRESAEWFDQRQLASEDFAQQCAERTGELLGHVDTASAARDLDMLRYVVGDQALNFLGYSYGTLLGATYAEIFPTHVGRMVLDGALNPASSNSEVVLAQAQGFEQALSAYLEDCLASTSCPWSGDADSALLGISELLAQLNENPIQASDGRMLGADAMVTAIITPLYNSATWEILSEVFATVQQGSADTAFGAVDWYYNRSEDGMYQDNSTEAFIAVNCLDYPVSTDRAQWAADAEALLAAAPIIGPYMAWGDQLCSVWPESSVRTPHEIHAEDSGDIIVIGTTGDPATPYRWAKELAGQLTHGHLVTYDGEGHTAYNKSTSCINDVVDAYLLRGVVPATDPRC